VTVGTLLVILFALSLGSFVKGVTGTGLPQIAIPVMASLLGVEHAVVVMAIPGVLSNATLFLVHSMSQVASLAVFDLYTTSRLLESMLAIVPMLALLPLGARFARRLSAEAFDRWVLAFLLLTATKLVYDVVVG
jgi:uncharacterized membrane protein YfcA